MHPITHLISSLLLALVLLPFYGTGSFIILFSVFIDLDHILFYYQKSNKLNVFRAYKFFKEGKGEKEFGSLFLFHNIEFLLILLLFYLMSPLMIFLLLGVLLHYALDMLYDYNKVGRTIKNYSILLYLSKNLVSDTN